MFSRLLPDLSLRRSALPLPRATEPRPVVAVPCPEDGETLDARAILRLCDEVDAVLGRLAVPS